MRTAQNLKIYPLKNVWRSDLKNLRLLLFMSRYTEWLKEKLWCKYCECEISRGQSSPHLKRKKHLLNVADYYNDKINKDSEVKESIKEI